MLRTRRIRLLRSGSDRSVRLPATNDAAMADVVLSDRPGANDWADFFRELRSIDVPDDFLVDRPMNHIAEDKDIFRVDQ